ncbi:hypothetical protein BKA65DRAFT_500714 [Rhexocercosporidium sp. MPI-PUGE-AT-0058]|nr:hypothetical protein BKA65DRAFT_500714 [Rhexocercosporidium sp. MPI-PUGE-AT-0058]
MHSLTVVISLQLLLSGLVASQSTLTITRTIWTVTVIEPPTSTKSTLTTKAVTPTTKKSSSKFIQTVIVTVTVTDTLTTRVTGPTKPTLTAAPDPNLTKCPVPLYYQCGGSRSYGGCTKCVAGASCLSQNDWYWQCVTTAIDD